MQIRNYPWTGRGGVERAEDQLTPTDNNTAIAEPTELTLREQMQGGMASVVEQFEQLRQQQQEHAPHQESVANRLEELRRSMAIAQPVVQLSFDLREKILDHSANNESPEDDYGIATRGYIDTDSMVVQSQPDLAEVFCSLYSLTIAEYRSDERFRPIRASLNRRCEVRIAQREGCYYPEPQ